MTAEKLKQYKGAVMEIPRLKRQIEQMPDNVLGITVVKSSLSREPYTQGHYTQRGIGLNPQKERAKAKLQKLQSLVTEVDEYILQIEDPEISFAIQSHYFDGKPWWQVTADLGSDKTEGAIKKQVQRDLKKSEKASRLSRLSRFGIL